MMNRKKCFRKHEKKWISAILSSSLLDMNKMDFFCYLLIIFTYWEEKISEKFFVRTMYVLRSGKPKKREKFVLQNLSESPE